MMNNQPNTLVAASNVQAPAFYLLQEQGYSVAYDTGREWWVATKGHLQFLAYSTIELCGLVYIHEHKGDKWGVSDEAIEAYLKLESSDEGSRSDDSGF